MVIWAALPVGKVGVKADMSNEKKFYRWVILLSCFILMAGPFSLVNTVHTLFIMPVTTELGFSISSFSLIFTISAVVVAGMSPVVGKLIEFVPLKVLMTAGALAVGLGFIAYSFAKSIYLFYVIGVVVSIGMAALTTIPISTMLTNWFSEARGKALGVAFAGTGTGTFFWMQIVSKILDNYGYHYAYLALGVIILAVSVPITSLAVYLSPEKKYNLAVSLVKVKKDDYGMEKIGMKQIMMKPFFWPFSMGLLIMGIAISGVQIHVQPYLGSLGYELSYSANIGSVLALAALMSSFVGGVIFDKFSTRGALLFFGSCALLGLASLLFAEHEKVPYIFAVLYGTCLCLGSLWPPYGVGKIFNQENYAATLGLVNLFFVIGAAAGPALSGMMADSAYGYKAAWTIYIVLTVVYLSLYMNCLPNNKSV